MKYKEIFEKSEQERDLLEEKLKKELAELRMVARLGQLAQNAKIGLMKKDIARLQTARHQKLEKARTS